MRKLIGVGLSATSVGGSGLWSLDDQYERNIDGVWAGFIYARYIRYTVTAVPSGTGGISLSDFHVYDDYDATGLDYSRSGATVSANYTYSSGHPPTNAIDTSLTSMWWGLGGTVGSVWWQMDLGRLSIIKSLSFQWNSSYYPTQYQISYSDDGTSFNRITTYSNSDNTLKVYNVGV